MALAHAWLAAVRDAGGLSEPPLAPQIPADYLQKPRRQHPPSTHTPSSPRSHRPRQPGRFPAPNRKRTRLAEIDPPNNPHVFNLPQSTFVMSQPQQSPSKTSMRAAARNAEDGTSKAPAMGRLVHPNATPRPRRSGRKPAQRPPASLVPALAAHEANMPEWGPAHEGESAEADDMDPPMSTIPSVTASTRSIARSRSPTKRMIDLKVAEKTVSSKTVESSADVPENVRKLYKEIQSLTRVPRGVIPVAIKNQVRAAARGDLDDPDDLDVLTATDPSGMSGEELLYEFKVLRRVHHSTAVCKAQHLHEPSWNERVHCRILEQAVCDRSGVEYHNITTARVMNELVPNNKYGEILQQKMIDYAITLGPPLVSESQLITRLAASPRPFHRSINPSDYSPLCHNPVAISIETKSPNGGTEHGEVQLSIWAIAYFNRLRSLTENPVSITLPLILVSGEHWKLLFARDLEGEIQIIDAVDFGTTADIIGCYTILKVLRLIISWAEGTFLAWFKDKVLLPE